MYDQFVAKDGRRGMDWTEVAVCIVQARGDGKEPVDGRRHSGCRGVAGLRAGGSRAAPLPGAPPSAHPHHIAALPAPLPQDGIGNANEGVLAASTVHGFFSPVVLQKSVLGAPTTLHLFEYTAR